MDPHPEEKGQAACSPADGTCSSNNTRDQDVPTPPRTTIMTEPHTWDVTCTTDQHQVVPCEAAALIPQLKEGSNGTTAAAVAAAVPTGPAVASASSTSGEPFHGFFERVPASWLYKFIKDLPAESQRALFGCSRGWARQVLATVTGVTLVLHSVQQLTEESRAEQTEVRRAAITKLLSTRQAFAVRLLLIEFQPFPKQLAGRVSAITAKSWGRHGAVVGVCGPWTAMTNLHTLHLETFSVDKEDMQGLCEAAESGQLQHLRALELETHVPHVPDAQRLACAVGQQLEELFTSCEALLAQVSHLRKLQRLTVSHCKVDSSTMQQLCEHPTLRHVTLCALRGVQGDHSQRSCNWDTLTLRYMHTEDTIVLPLASVQKIRVLHCVANFYVANFTRDRLTDPLVAMHILNQHADKMACLPDECDQAFTLDWPVAAMAPFVKCMIGVKQLTLRSVCLKQPHMLALFWHVLPPSVSTIEFQDPGAEWGVDCTELWDGLPQHVVRIMFSNPYKLVQMCDVLRTAPSHVGEIVLDWPGLSSEKQASLRAAAAKHLELIINRC